MIFGKKRIFLDYAGGELNPSGIHKEGIEAKRRLEEARAQMASILRCQARDIIFTSGGTESDNLAVLGVFEAMRERFERPHIIISKDEHPAVYESAKEAERRGAEVSVLPVERIISAIKENTILVSVIYASNETGAINNAPKLARLIKDIRQKSGRDYPYIHTDATSAYEYLEVDVNKLPADLITIERVLVVRPRVSIRPLIVGGGQERGLRAGTEDVPRIEAFAKSFAKSVKERPEETERLQKLKERFMSLAKNIPNIVVNTPDNSLPNIVNISFPGKLHEFLAIKLDEKGIAVSTGSSCDSSKNEADKEALRFSFGERTREGDVERAVRALQETMI